MNIEIIKGTDNNPVAEFFSSPSSTPETDAAIYPMNGVDIVWPDFARKLERERDEARESLRHITEYGTEEINAAVELRQKLASALVERDKALEKIKRQTARIRKLEGATNHASGLKKESEK